ncbi:hypothetical protein OF846_000420 [Rhodotorula toruloides]|nr:hypothetical protein OF846_000420 [Rhodotorula toruloides]
MLATAVGADSRSEEVEVRAPAIRIDSAGLKLGQHNQNSSVKRLNALLAQHAACESSENRRSPDQCWRSAQRQGAARLARHRGIGAVEVTGRTSETTQRELSELRAPGRRGSRPKWDRNRALAPRLAASHGLLEIQLFSRAQKEEDGDSLCVGMCEH